MSANELLNIAAPEYVRLTPAFYDALEGALGVDDNAKLSDVVEAAMRVSRLNGVKPSEQTIVNACTRLLREQEQLQKDTEGQAPHEKLGPGLGTSMIEWLRKLQIRQLCYFLAGFDPLKSEELYYHADAAVVSQAFGLRSEYEMECNRANYEASLYGFGGKYEKDTGQTADANVMDLTKGTASSDALRSLKSFGF